MVYALKEWTLCMPACKHVCECGCERVCVYVCVFERERERERESVCVCTRTRVRALVIQLQMVSKLTKHRSAQRHYISMSMTNKLQISKTTPFWKFRFFQEYLQATQLCFLWTIFSLKEDDKKKRPSNYTTNRKIVWINRINQTVFTVWFILLF